jgi:hypothetical protein
LGSQMSPLWRLFVPRLLHLRIWVWISSFYFLGLGFELRALLSLGGCSTTWATPPVQKNSFGKRNIFMFILLGTS